MSQQVKRSGLASLALLGAFLAALVISGFLNSHPRVAQAVVPDPSITGPRAVGYYDKSYSQSGTFNGRIYYPATSAGQNAPPDTANGPYPAVVVAPATFTGFDKTTWISNHLTSHGYVVLSFTPPSTSSTDPNQNANGIKGGITTIISEAGTSGTKIFNLVVTDEIGASGISLGGASALIAAGQDTRVKAVVTFTPGYPNQTNQQLVDDSTAAITAPTQIQSGEMDCISPGGGIRYYNLLANQNAGKEWLEIKNGNHTKFVDGGGNDTSFSGGSCPSSSLSMANQQTYAKKYATSWFGYFLKNNTTDYDTYIFGATAQGDVGTLLSNLKYRSPAGLVFDSSQQPPPPSPSPSPTGPPPPPPPPPDGSTTVTFSGIAADDGAVGATTTGGSPVLSSETYGLLTGKTNWDYKHYRPIMSFDTSSIPDGATILSAYVQVAKFSIPFANPWNDPSGNLLSVDVKNGCFGACTMETSDWAAAPTATGVAQISKFSSGGGSWWQWWSTEAVTNSSGNFTSSGLSAINKTGKTQVKLRWNSFQVWSGSFAWLKNGADTKLVVQYQ